MGLKRLVKEELGRSLRKFSGSLNRIFHAPTIKESEPWWRH